MLVAPPLLVGFFRLADSVAEGGRPGVGDAFSAFRRVSLALWVVAFICADLVGSISVSVRATLGNFVLSLLWGVLLTSVIVGSVVLLPLLLVSLPVLAYASYALYRNIFPAPPTQGGGG